MLDIPTQSATITFWQSHEKCKNSHILVTFWLNVFFSLPFGEVQFLPGPGGFGAWGHRGDVGTTLGRWEKLCRRRTRGWKREVCWGRTSMCCNFCCSFSLCFWCFYYICHLSFFHFVHSLQFSFYIFFPLLPLLLFLIVTIGIYWHSIAVKVFKFNQNQRQFPPFCRTRFFCLWAVLLVGV